ncbi:hypothetical protein [Micromonospora endolithica]|uniref:DUF5666 domain-containing protein n=1 Tax=Micromonospora endolithica TaxID=230091 RepID=A0A3A9ZDG1_9ACTN|nr:hypothetical protein [Micromonospora endolithica]RKN46209.1 hypothetical protein D7223_14870 [Micromonospora endolithica]TWJ25073.1 hypothetical protein JD76_05233 [Micromonospora endolithica]
MARWGLAGTTLLAAVTLGLTGCGAVGAVGGPAPEPAVEVTAAMGTEGQALAAMGFDAAELDVLNVAAPAASPSPSSTEARPGRGERGEEWRKRRQARVLLRKNTLHGEVVVQTKEGGTKTVAVQRGEVTAIDGQKMTVKSTDGFTMTWTFGPELRVLERRRTVQPEAVEVGSVLGVAGAKEGENGVARLIVLPRGK